MTPQTALCRLWAAIRFLPALIALVVLGLVPAGVMPTQDASGGLVMVICSGEGAVSMTFDPATGVVMPAKPAPAKPGCDWAMAQTVADLALPVVLPLPVLGTGRAAPALAADLWRPAHDPRGIQARGPPSAI